MIGSKEIFQQMREGEIKSEPFADGFEFDDSMENYLLSLLERTIYDEAKKKEYENKIKDGLTMEEYEMLKNKFYADKINPVTQGGTYGQKDLARHLRRLK